MLKFFYFVWGSLHQSLAESTWWVLPVCDVCTSQVLGLDCEWVSNDQSQQDGMPARRPVSLLQLASVSGICVLVRLHLLPCIPDSLKQLLVDRRWYTSVTPPASLYLSNLSNFTHQLVGMGQDLVPGGAHSFVVIRPNSTKQ